MTVVYLHLNSIAVEYDGDPAELTDETVAQLLDEHIANGKTTISVESFDWDEEDEA